MGLLNDLENQLERQIPARLPTTLQQALDDYRPACPDDQWRCPATTAIPVPSPPVTAPSGGKSPCSAAPRATALNFNGSQKTATGALTLAAQGLSYARAGQWAGSVKSAIGKWLRRTPLPESALSAGSVLELDGLGTRTRAGCTESKVIRDANTGIALGSFWLGDYCRLCGGARLLRSTSVAEGRCWAQRLLRVTSGAAGESKPGTVWMEHNLLALQRIQGRLNQTIQLETLPLAPASLTTPAQSGI